MCTEDSESREGGKNQNYAFLHRWIEENHDALRKVLLPLVCSLSQEIGLPTEEVLLDLLTEVTRISLEKSASFDATYSPQFWLLRIGVNVVKRWRDENIKWQHRFKHLPSLPSDHDEERDGFFYLLDVVCAAPKGEIDVARQAIGNVWATNSLAACPPNHRSTIMAFAKHAMDEQEAAAELGIKPGAARVRLYRARQWFREWIREENVSLSSGERT